MEKFPFTSELLDEIKRTVSLAQERTSGPHYAAFDADGTLWDSDLGEQFFQYQIDHCDLESLKKVDPWDYYNSTKAVDPIKAYLWLAQISAGQPIAQVKEWAQKAVEKEGARVFESQKNLIAWLQSQGIEVMIVTASIQWAVEPGSHLVNIPSSHVLGIRTKIDDKGIVTPIQDGLITWREGKAKALLERTKGIAPLFCSGNTYGDIALLETSQGARLCIQTQTEKTSLFEEEDRLYHHARKNNWQIHHFFKK